MLYKCPKCGKVVKRPRGLYYCSSCGPGVVLRLFSWADATCDELYEWVDDVFTDAHAAVRAALESRTEEQYRIAQDELASLESYIRAIRAKRCMLP